MAVPDFQAFFLPMLEFAADGKIHSLQEAYEVLADNFNLMRPASMVQRQFAKCVARKVKQGERD